jgi:PAT family beta-lactamase induction signal transducer AmpG
MSITKKTAAIWSGTLYYAQGLPFSIIRQMSVVFFKDQGVSLQSLGLVSLYGIPWTFKFLWSPFVDSVATKRKWVIVMEAALALSIAFLASTVSMGITPQTAAVFFLVMAVLSATHDIATDGFYLEALNKDDQAKYSGWIVAAYRLAMLTGSGFLVSLSGKLGWGSTFGVAAFIFGALTVWHFFVLPQPQKVEGSIKKLDMVAGFKSFLKLPGIASAIGFIVLFKLGDALLFGMSTPFLLDAGMTKAELGVASGVFGTIAAIVASMAGGWFIARYKLRRGLWVFGIVQNFAIPIYALVAWMKPGAWALTGAIIVEQIAAGLGTAAYSNFVMRQNNQKFKATHYAIATGMMSFTMMLGGAISGFGAQRYGYAVFFTLAFVASVPGLILIPFIARRPECQ